MNKKMSEHTLESFINAIGIPIPKELHPIKKNKWWILRVLRGQNYQKEISKAMRRAEDKFRIVGIGKFSADSLIEIILGFSYIEVHQAQEFFRNMPNRLLDIYLAQEVEKYISPNWKGDFSRIEMSEGLALYLNCLREEIMSLPQYRDQVMHLFMLKMTQKSEVLAKSSPEFYELLLKSQLAGDSTIDAPPPDVNKKKKKKKGSE